MILADDSGTFRRMCRINLELDGFRVLEANDRDELERVVGREPDAVVVLDARFGRHDGIAVGWELRGRHQDLRFVLVSGDTRLHGDPSARRLSDIRLAKPFDLERLTEELRRLV